MTSTTIAPPNSDWNSTRPDSGARQSPWRVYNTGSNSPAELIDYIAALEKALGKNADVELSTLQAGDVPDAFANVEDLVEQFHYKPSTTLEEGINRLGEWNRNYFKA